MPNEGAAQADQDLLARLNALKKTHIDLDDTKYRVPVTAHIQPSTDPSPAKALHNDLTARFQSLSGQQTKNQSDAIDTSGHNPFAEDDSETIEELLNELGGEGAWNIEKDEATQIDDLLHSANDALKDIKSNEEVERVNPVEDLTAGNDTSHELPSIDIEYWKPDPDYKDQEADDDQGPTKSKKDLEAEIDHEANDIIARLKDALKTAPPEPDSDDDDQIQASKTHPSTISAFDLPTIPSKDPEPHLQHSSSTTNDPDTDLASRFASLGLPSTPSNLPSAPTTKPSQNQPAKFGSSARYGGHTDEEIDSWCVICLEDATLRCVGCDGDLYCAKCWIEGHRGPDAGYEEKRHRAVEFNKGVKKAPRRRVAA